MKELEGTVSANAVGELLSFEKQMILNKQRAIEEISKMPGADEETKKSILESLDRSAAAGSTYFKHMMDSTGIINTDAFPSLNLSSGSTAQPT